MASSYHEYLATHVNRLMDIGDDRAAQTVLDTLAIVTKEEPGLYEELMLGIAKKYHAASRSFPMPLVAESLAEALSLGWLNAVHKTAEREFAHSLCKLTPTKDVLEIVRNRLNTSMPVRNQYRADKVPFPERQEKLLRFVGLAQKNSAFEWLALFAHAYVRCARSDELITMFWKMTPESSDS